MRVGGAMDSSIAGIQVGDVVERIDDDVLASSVGLFRRGNRTDESRKTLLSLVSKALC